MVDCNTQSRFVKRRDCKANGRGYETGTSLEKRSYQNIIPITEDKLVGHIAKILILLSLLIIHRLQEYVA
jgi:hypothetical protein